MGLLLLLLPVQATLAASSASSSPATFYDRIKNEVDQMIVQNPVEPEVRSFIKTFYFRKGLPLTDDQIDAALRGDEGQACALFTGNVPEGSDAGCLGLVQNIQRMVTDEERVRKLGRDLQLIATSNELPVSDLPGRSQQFATDMRGLVNIWSTDQNSTSSSSSSSSTSTSSSSSSSSKAPPIRTVVIDQQTLQSLQAPLQQLGNALNTLTTEKRIAAVWRYQYGVRLVANNRKPDYPPPFIDGQSGNDTERQYLFARPPDIEAALQQIWNILLNYPFQTPLQPNETALLQFPDDLLKSVLPDNVIVWARVDAVNAKNPQNQHPLGDVGLQWRTPLDPVLPSLTGETSGEPILGGNYPPEPIDTSQTVNGNQKPVDGAGLCSDPTQQQGYLCRPFVLTNSADPCPGADSPDPTNISLITCRKPGDQPNTLSGPDVCRDIGYQIPQPFDVNTQCKVDISCTCDNIKDADARTYGKDANGVIKICINTDQKIIDHGGATYLLFHELHHAYQKCGSPPAKDTQNAYAGMNADQKNQACCAWEGEAYRAQCELEERDGVFAKTKPVNGISLNAETCAELFTNDACIGDEAGSCYTSHPYTTDVREAFFAAMKQNAAKPVTCAAATDQKTMDPRVKDLLDFVRQKDDVCTPGQAAAYKNRIGNNMCFIGQCVEQSLELDRLTGAQSPATVGDESFPWNDPLTGKPLGNQLINPPLASSPLPLYRPELIMNELDQALCQLDGLPAKSPPILCAIQSGRQFQFPITDPATMAATIAKNLQDEQVASNNLLQLAPTIGARLGTNLYENYLRSASRSLSDVIGMAVKLFTEMTTVNFPVQMCPTDQSLPQSITSPPAPSGS